MTFKKSIIAMMALSLSGIAWGQDDGLKIYISADMEGVVGAVTGEQLGPGGFEYQRFREFMTAEVNAAIDAARAAGATEFVISDSHGNGQNLLIDKLPDDVTVIRSWPRELSMMAGIDESFDGVIFIGYHASTANTRGVRAHTMSSANITSLRLNGMEMTEGSMAAAAAGRGLHDPRPAGLSAGQALRGLDHAPSPAGLGAGPGRVPGQLDVVQRAAHRHSRRAFSPTHPPVRHPPGGV